MASELDAAIGHQAMNAVEAGDFIVGNYTPLAVIGQDVDRTAGAFDHQLPDLSLEAARGGYPMLKADAVNSDKGQVTADLAQGVACKSSDHRLRPSIKRPPE